MSWYHLQEQKKNNRGSALVMVMAVIALLAILITIILSLSVMNYRMKAANEKSTDHFYTAEEGVEELRAGLALQLSNAAADSYESVMTEFSASNEAERKNKFTSLMSSKLRTSLKGTSDTVYSVTVLNNYLKNQYDDSTRTGVLVTTDQESGSNLEVTDRSVTLRNVLVTCYGENSYVSQIKTDLVMSYPQLNLGQKAVVSDLLSYSLIADHSFIAGDSTGLTDVRIRGNTYLGKEGVKIHNSTLHFSKEKEENVLITGGEVNMDAGSKVTMSGIQLWGRQILVDSSSYNMDGTIYLADDLVFYNNAQSAGNRPKVSAVLKGKYYGFGEPGSAAQAEAVNAEDVQASPADYSSSIIVNGVNTSLDLSGLEELYIAGNAYVNTTAAQLSGGMKNSSDVATGESISIKSSQLAYLVPVDCVAPKTENGGLNPMPLARYEALKEEVGEGSLVDLQVESEKLGCSLDSLGVRGYEVQCYPIQKIGSMVYFFMTFEDQEKAASFAEKYYQDQKNFTTLQENLNLYTQQILLPGSQFYCNGSILVNDKSENGFRGIQLQEKGEQEKIQWKEQSIEDWNCYEALCHKLVRQYDTLSDSEKQNDIYDNLVKNRVSADINYTISEGSSKSFITSSTDPLAAMVVNGDLDLTSTVVKAKDKMGEEKTGRLCLIIASGDVTVGCDFFRNDIGRGQDHSHREQYRDQTG